ncbi:hypothetical protein VQ643_06760 [Pseudomonas sp. F1_0610]|uniref:hypothetical protein n=1 Tax=Pseudomonas sp. F1_0610 TaxID=3114284 RepID=UPI0039C31F56
MNELHNHLQGLISLNGAIAAAVVDSASGMLLGSLGEHIDIEIAAAAHCEVLKTQRKTLKLLGQQQQIEDMLITLNNQYHLLRPLSAHPELFVYYVLEREQANLALARLKLQRTELKIRF